MTIRQRTIKNRINCTGIGLHSGETVRMWLRPAEANTGIVFERTDLPADSNRIPARFDRVTDTMMGTTISNEHGAKVMTVEHLMSALSGCGIDNAIVEVDGPEVPVMDGSAAPFVFLIDCAGYRDLDAPRRYLKVLKRVMVEDGIKSVEITPDDGFVVAFDIDFPTPVIAQQSFEGEMNASSFKTRICRARTFGFAPEVEYLRGRGLARGGSLDNAIVIDGDRILNEGGLRYTDEFVRHKVLDAVGDLYLAGGPIVGHYHGVRAGHALNNAALLALFADEDAFAWVDSDAIARPAAHQREGLAAAAF